MRICADFSTIDTHFYHSIGGAVIFCKPHNDFVYCGTTNHSLLTNAIKPYIISPKHFSVKGSPHMYTIGIDLGGTNIAAGIVDASHRIIKKDSIPTGPLRDADEITADMAALCRKLCKDAQIPLSGIARVGVAAPGVANRASGNIETSCNLPTFVMYPLVEKLSSLLDGKQVLIENDANAAAIAEAAAGAAKGTRYSVMITLGTGVGGGVVIDGSAYAGFNFAGAELGHIVIEKDGRPCSCGRKGCWERYSSATGLIEMTREKLQECRAAGRKTQIEDLCGGDSTKISGKTAFQAARAGDAAGREVVDMYIDYLVVGLANIINIFQPEILTIGGGVCYEGDYLLKPINDRIYKEIYTKDHDPKTEIRIAMLGNDAGIIGAAALR